MFTSKSKFDSSASVRAASARLRVVYLRWLFSGQEPTIFISFSFFTLASHRKTSQEHENWPNPMNRNRPRANKPNTQTPWPNDYSKKSSVNPSLFTLQSTHLHTTSLTGQPSEVYRPNNTTFNVQMKFTLNERVTGGKMNPFSNKSTWENSNGELPNDHCIPWTFNKQMKVQN